MAIKSFQGARVLSTRKVVKNILVKDIMSKSLVLFRPKQTIHDVMKSFIKYRISGGPVVDKHGELMGMGVPVIANSNVGDIDLIVGEEESGLIVKSLDTANYEDTLRKLKDFCKSKDEIRNIGKKYYNLSKGVSSYWKIYNELLK